MRWGEERNDLYDGGGGRDGTILLDNKGRMKQERSMKIENVWLAKY